MTTATKPPAVVTGASSGIGLEPAEQFARHLAGRPVEALAVNAGVGVNGEFAGETRLADQLNVVDLNVRSAVHLTKRVVPGMVGRGHGRVLFTASIAGTSPAPYLAVYAASKAFHAAEIAEAGYQALMAGEGKLVPGAAKNKLPAAASRLLPDEAEAKQQGKMTKPGSAGA